MLKSLIFHTQEGGSTKSIKVVFDFMQYSRSSGNSCTCRSLNVTNFCSKTSWQSNYLERHKMHSFSGHEV